MQALRRFQQEMEGLQRSDQAKYNYAATDAGEYQ